jgi:hypothetical protein
MPFARKCSDDIIADLRNLLKQKWPLEFFSTDHYVFYYYRAQSVSANSDNFSDIPVYLPKRLINRDTLRTEKAGAIFGDIQTIF